MRTLIYKRTHPGDPDATGWFGINDCMGPVRAREFDAVIGVGGIGAEPEGHGLAGKVNWIGIGPCKVRAIRKRGPDVVFEHFLFYGSDGPSFRKLAPKLAARMYANNVRAVMDSLSLTERREVASIVALANDAPPSTAKPAGSPAARSARGRPRASAAKSIRGCSC